MSTTGMGTLEGAGAGTQRARMLGLVLALAIAGGALAFISMGSLGENLVYYWSPTEMKDHGAAAVGATIRLGGQVVPGSVQAATGGGPLRFRVTDGATEVAVETTEIPPAMFREGIGVVVEGTLAGGPVGSGAGGAGGGVFRSNRMMVKHDNEYRAPKEGEVVDQEKMRREMEQMFQDAAKTDMGTTGGAGAGGASSGGAGAGGAGSGGAGSGGAGSGNATSGG